VSDRDAFREARDAGLAARQAKRLEAATYTAAEVKVLTETASKVAYALGRKDAGEETAAAFEPALYNSPDGDAFEHTHPKWEGEPECPACWVQTIRQVLARVASQAPGATSDATSGVPGQREVSEAVRSPQEPCDDLECWCCRPARVDTP
jgi:hypothetical protein